MSGSAALQCGMESTPLHDLYIVWPRLAKVTRQDHTFYCGSCPLYILILCCLLAFGVVWKMLTYMIWPQLVNITMKSYACPC